MRYLNERDNKNRYLIDLFHRISSRASKSQLTAFLRWKDYTINKNA